MQLSREHVLAAALGLLDEAGLEQLTMRRLAAALGVQNGAAYWHFRSKQALLEAMADTLLAGLTAGLDTESLWTLGSADECPPSDRKIGSELWER